MIPSILKDEKALFRNILGAFIFDLFLTYLIVVIISLFISDFYSGPSPYGGIRVSFQLFYEFFIAIYFFNLLSGLFTSQTPGMKIYNIYFNKVFNLLNFKNIIPVIQNAENPGFIKYFIVFILDLIIGALFLIITAVILYYGILTGAIPTGGFIIDKSIDVFIPHLIYFTLAYYVFSISIWRRTPGMAILKISVPSYKKTITIFERIFILIIGIVLFFLIAPYFV